MAELTTLARPYAKAAFEAALADSALAEWSEALKLLAALSLEDKVQALVASPNLTAEQKSTALIEVCGDALNNKAHSLFAYWLTTNVWVCWHKSVNCSSCTRRNRRSQSM